MTPTLMVGSLAAAPGQAVSGWLEVPAATDPGTRIPVTVVHGARPGPVLGLVAGTHGAEYTAVLALQRLRPRLDPSAMRGSAILVHLANPPAFYDRRVYYGPDGHNLNRVYPGRADGTVSERIAHALTTEVIERVTHLIDMHCGDGNESLRPHTYWIVTGQAALDRQTRDLALAYGLDHILVDRGRPRDPAKSLYTSNTAITRGKPAITTESGQLGQTDAAAVSAHEAGALSALAHLGILDAPSVRVTHPVWIDRAEVLRAPMAGLWRPAVERQQVVAAGALIGQITDAFGDLLHEVRAPFAGEILYVVATPPVRPGEPLGEVGRPAETPGVE